MLDALNFIDPGVLIEQVSEAQDVYRWRYDRAGRDMAGGAVPPKPTPAEWKEDAHLIDEFVGALREFTNGAVTPATLSTGLGTRLTASERATASAERTK